MGKNCPEWPQNRVFRIFKKILLLAFHEKSKIKTSIVIDISPHITYLVKFWFSIYELKCCWIVKLQDSLKSNISRKKWMMKFVFVMSRNIKIFYKFILPSWVWVSRHAQSIQNKQFAYLCNISRKTWGMKLFFCSQINTTWYYHFGCVQTGSPKVPKITNL